MAIDANKSMVDYSKLAINGAFLLNGAGAVAILTAKEKMLYPVALWFAFGAGLAVLCAGLSYLVQNKISQYWLAKAHNKKINISKKEIFYYRAVACAAFALSLALFAIAAIHALGILKCTI